jgi:hypothetical protein
LSVAVPFQCRQNNGAKNAKPDEEVNALLAH